MRNKPFYYIYIAVYIHQLMHNKPYITYTSPVVFFVPSMRHHYSTPDCNQSLADSFASAHSQVHSTDYSKVFLVSQQYFPIGFVPSYCLSRLSTLSVESRHFLHHSEKYMHMLYIQYIQCITNFICINIQMLKELCSKTAHGYMTASINKFIHMQSFIYNIDK